ncbi:WW domain-containing transcription regulator protein 1 isoform X3 [Hippopotamus amphibius kiboko]|uniref:WW domain-containing transcription regulator protein 1 isoform X3 n=1 Tax=Hippopotamus amphibius kiboko TaxID=575201 RepID=UPI002597DCFA|nr:WW domain-containing transcription regulator protein 1 isoform X3 [Hippopotamus amphibius kiboko]
MVGGIQVCDVILVYHISKYDDIVPKAGISLYTVKRSKVASCIASSATPQPKAGCIFISLWIVDEDNNWKNIHIEKITTWQDPRKAMNQPLNHMNLHPAATSTPASQRSMAVSQPNLVMNHQHQQQMAPSSLSQQNHPPQNPPAGLMSMPNALTTQQQQQQKLRLQRIQMERERIRMRQEELMRQEAALCRQLPMEAETLATVQAAVNPPTMTPDMRSISNNSSDPFLNGGPYHSREQSTDSGLGLGCYSVPTTPEDFLSNVDEMDTGENAGQTPMNINPQQTRFPDFLDCLPGTNVDLGTLESEDLIPLFNEVESALNKSEPFLTWL